MAVGSTVLTRIGAAPMTQCECAEVPFAEVERVMRETQLSPSEATRRAGCGQTCTACLPDLRRFLGCT